MFVKTSYNLYEFENLYKDVTYGNFLVEITSNKEEKEYINKYIGKVIKYNNNLKYKNTKIIIYTDKNYLYKYGDIIQVKGQFNYAETARNYKVFNYRRYLWQNNIYGILEVENGIKISSKNSVENLLNNIKSRLENNISLCISKEEYSNFLKGILLGNTNEISEEIKSNFRDASLSHILAISGMHISYIIILISYLLNFINSRKLRNIISVIFIFLFIIMIGKTPSSFRAFIMFSMIVISEFLYRKSNIFINLCTGLIIILILNPLNIENLGVWLSFGGTIGIISIYSKFKIKLNGKILNYIYQNFILSVCVQICIFPVIVYNFNTISLTFFISNIIVSFFIAPIMFLGFIICIFGNFLFIGNFLSIIEIFLIKIIFYSAEFISNISISKIYIKTPNIITLFFYYIFIFLIISRKSEIKKIFKKHYKKIISAILTLCLILNAVKIFDKSIEIYFMDIGQGDCTLIKTETNKVILIDGGEGNSDKYDQGKNVVFPYLLDRGITQIDYIMISHFDSDHCGGLFYIIENLKVKNVIIGLQYEKYQQYIDLLNLIRNKNINLIVAKNGMKIKIDKTSYFDILWPDINNMIEKNSINNNSIVAKFCYKNKTILFTGDIEESAEKFLVKIHKSNLKSDILKAAHHGSKTSSSDEFISKVKPQIVLIGVGKSNSYGHPSKSVIDRYENYNTQIYRTDQMGEIIIKLNSKGNFLVNKLLE